ncbi:MAG: hypothetical protein V4659_09320 [Pseudomonadota bacterium]
MDADAQRREIDANYDFLQRHLTDMLADHAGEYALLKSCKVVGYYGKVGSAYDEGMRRFPDGRFSIQEVTDEPLHLGFWSVAGT